jgi:acetyl-CoA carboxylase biotin carboxylase subunit
VFKKILIANRGEIAVRVLKACQKLDIPAATVYSEADKEALHVVSSQEAYCIGPAQVSQSYLNAAGIIAVARTCGADAIHPGYGFLAENAGFARACAEAGIAFIGPGPEAIAKMGLKLESRKVVKEAGVPLTPGSGLALETIEEAREQASRLGYPVMLKASAGGGGIGMQLVARQDELEKAYKACRERACAVFGNSEVYLEKCIERPRHIEIQIFADSHGNIVHLGERECSVQRRHQKIVEEAPSPLVDNALRDRMGRDAVRLAGIIGYLGAGTVEFLVDGDKNHYFLEMNTRLQVEHPVTETVTGIDLVVEQIRVTAGCPLSVRQEDIQLKGHSLECRLYAEDPVSYKPSTGMLEEVSFPELENIRVDSGIRRGHRVTPYYDAMLAKVVSRGHTREESLDLMLKALEEIKITGVKTNIDLLAKVISHPDFRKGNLSTDFIEKI